jgi:hypothetical protein
MWWNTQWTVDALDYLKDCLWLEHWRKTCLYEWNEKELPLVLTVKEVSLCLLEIREHWNQENVSLGANRRFIVDIADSGIQGFQI